MKTFKHIDDGFNKIKPWLSKKLKDRHMSVDRFSVATGYLVDATAIKRWYNDTCRPYPKSMSVVCRTLSRLPIYNPDGSESFEEVPLSEGLATYSPRPRAWLAHYTRRPTQ